VQPSGESTTILHLDMDAFFASVEALDDPSLAGIPLIVGGEGPRGVVASCSYEARMFGVRSAMPSTEARRRCPAAVFVRGRYDRYSELSDALHRILLEMTPLVEPIALDEAFLDVAGAVRRVGPAREIASLLRARVLGELQLCCSVGVARSKFLAKLASRAAKPTADRSGVSQGRGVVVIEPQEELAFLHPLPVRAIWGVGPRTAERLARYGLGTVGDLAAVGEETLCRLLGRAHGTHLYELAWARDSRSVVPSRPLKSVGHEETFSVDLHDLEALRPHTVRMSDSLAARLRHAGVAGRTITVKVRFGDFTTITRSRTIGAPTAAGTTIRTVAIELLEQVELSGGVRLLGVSASGLSPAAEATIEQLSFDDPKALADDATSGRAATAARAVARREVDEAVDEVRRRFGSGSVGPASVKGQGARGAPGGGRAPVRPAG
jgi:DNA polymerase-4